MLISEAIEQLQRLQASYGDVEFLIALDPRGSLVARVETVLPGFSDTDRVTTPFWTEAPDVDAPVNNVCVFPEAE